MENITIKNEFKYNHPGEEMVFIFPLIDSAFGGIVSDYVTDNLWVKITKKINNIKL